MARNNGTSTDKGSGNVALASIPSVGKLLAVPPTILSAAAPGDSTPTTAYLGYAWSGNSATLDSGALSGRAGLNAAGVGSHTLSVGGNNFQASITQPATPNATFSASGSTSATTLSWSVTAGSFLAVGIDQGAANTSAASGSVGVSDPVNTTYHLVVVTKEGGAVKTLTTGTPLLSAPTSITVLAGLNLPVNKAYIQIRNDGGSTMNWTATGQTPGLFSVATPSGQTLDTDTIVLTLNVSSVGTYAGTVLVNAGSAGSQTVQVNVVVVNTLYQNFLPLVRR